MPSPSAVPPAVPPRPWARLPVGTRVVVRRRLTAAEAAESGARWADVVGILTASGDGGLRVRPDRSPDLPEVSVAADEVEAVKPVPPRRPRRGRPEQAPDAT
ncbi:hypothetical protein M1843_00600 [Isoptericola sp. 4D.3]|uniref:Histone acetyltransferase Rv0428c-like SH3 domain-containing protein n=1 Tax=Isoptericola peretonis TaxID=2918523 RepID=A0ABT0IYE2_9MICO|nr:hypothetical protein [Isoptericola sp. 4D.3]